MAACGASEPVERDAGAGVRSYDTYTAERAAPHTQRGFGPAPASGAPGATAFAFPEAAGVDSAPVSTSGAAATVGVTSADLAAVGIGPSGTVAGGTDAGAGSAGVDREQGTDLAPFGGRFGAVERGAGETFGAPESTQEASAVVTPGATPETTHETTPGATPAPAAIPRAVPRAPASGLSDEQSFAAVTARETIESDAERLRRQRAARVEVAPRQLPSRATDTGPDIVAFALTTRHGLGEQRYSRPFGSRARAARICRRYPGADIAQRAFLEAGGPERDRLGIDPDGDGFACAWSPVPFRAARG